MNKETEKFRLSSTLFILFVLGITFIAFSIRGIGLEKKSLYDFEAGNAFNALDLTHHQTAKDSSQPLYQNLTSVLFWLAGATNFSARFFPALVGSLLCLAPLLLRNEIGVATSLVASALFAIEPGLVAASQQADSAIFSVVFIGYFLVSVWQKRYTCAGIFLGLSLLSGARTWIMLLGLLLSFSIYWLIFMKKNNGMDGLSEVDRKGADQLLMIFRKSLPACAFVVILLGTLFFSRPGQLAGVIGGFQEFLAGFSKQVAPVNVSNKVFITTMMTTSMCSILLGFISGITGAIKKDRFTVFIGLFFLIMMLGISFWPAHRLTDSACVIFPAVLLAARQIQTILHGIKVSPRVVIITSLLQFSLLVFAILNLQWILTNYAFQTSELSLHLVAGGVAFVLMIVISILEIWGWSKEVANGGIMLTAFLILMAFSVSQTSRTIFTESGDHANPFAQEASVDAAWMSGTFQQIAQMNARNRSQIDIAIDGTVPESIRWQMRDLSATVYSAGIPGLEAPSIVVSFSEKSPNLAYDYRGQRFAIKKFVLMDEWTALQWLKWIFQRQTEWQSAYAYVWVRSDLLPAILD